MFIKFLFLLILFIIILVYDGRKWKQKSKREVVAYGIMMFGALYLSLIYITGKHWPNLNDLFGLFFAEPAKRIVELIKLPE